MYYYFLPNCQGGGGGGLELGHIRFSLFPHLTIAWQKVPFPLTPPADLLGQKGCPPSLFIQNTYVQHIHTTQTLIGE